MIVTWQIGLRLAAIVLLTVLVQVSFLSYLSILGATPDVLPVVIAVLGLLGGAVTGAVAGFATGLLVDSLLLQTLGVSSLVLLSVGYLAGRYREQFEIDSRMAPALLAGGLTLLATAGFVGLQLMLGVEATVSLLVVREILIKALLGFLLAFPLYPLIRFALRPALVLEEPPTRRRIFRSRRPARRRKLRRASTEISRLNNAGARLRPSDSASQGGVA
jgi:rod shape-determining protein MreD